MEKVQGGIIQGVSVGSQTVQNGTVLFVQAHQQGDLCGSINVRLLLPQLAETLNVKWFQADCS